MTRKKAFMDAYNIWIAGIRRGIEHDDLQKLWEKYYLARNEFFDKGDGELNTILAPHKQHVEVVEAHA